MTSAKSVFSMPTPMKITGRSSTITNAFASAIIPVLHPTDDEIHASLRLLGMSVGGVWCSYCGGPHTEWDHLRPTIKNKRPTGYISEIKNLVPACGKCNQSKGNKNWREWMLSDARLSPKTRNIKRLDQKIANLAAYENQSGITNIDFEALLGSSIWSQHWKNWEAVLGQMENAQILADEIREELRRSFPSPET
ncbi:MAG: HNH endonuclease [Proteobacteria bacterium]|nr:HNH endonuclease [Pseudomonadota bacterium]